MSYAMNDTKQDKHIIYMIMIPYIYKDNNTYNNYIYVFVSIHHHH